MATLLLAANLRHRQLERGDGHAGGEVLETDCDSGTYVQLRIWAIEQPADQPQVGLLDEFDVDKHERKVVLEARQQRLAHDGPRPYGAAAAHRREFESRVGAVAMRAHHIGGHGELTALSRSAPTVRTCSAAADQNGADVSSGTGSGRPVTE